MNGSAPTQVTLGKVVENFSVMLRGGAAVLVRLMMCWVGVRVLAIFLRSIDPTLGVLVDFGFFLSLPLFWLAIMHCAIASYLYEPSPSLMECFSVAGQAYRQSMFVIIPGTIFGAIGLIFILPAFYILAISVLLLAILIAEKPDMGDWPRRLIDLLARHVPAFLIGGFAFGFVLLLVFIGTQDVIGLWGSDEVFSVGQQIAQTCRNTILHTFILLSGAAVYAEMRNIEAGV